MGFRVFLTADSRTQVLKEMRPTIVLCGCTFYPRDYDYADFKAIANEIGALTMADLSNVAGMIAVGVLANATRSGPGLNCLIGLGPSIL